MWVLSSGWCNLIAAQASRVSTATIGALVVAVAAYDRGLYLVLLLCSKFRRLVSHLSHREAHVKFSIAYLTCSARVYFWPSRNVESNIMILQ